MRVKKVIKSRLEKYHESKLAGEDFIILSNNCWGYELYGSTGKKYNTPFVGLFMYPDCFIRFIADINFYIDASLGFTNKSKYLNEITKYPIGVMQGGIEIHFLHYKDEIECISKWTRRKERFKKDFFERKLRVFVKICDRDGCEYSHLKSFHEIKDFNKISFGIEELGMCSHLKIKRKHAERFDKKKIMAPNGLTLYQKRYAYFDMVEWIRSGTIRHTLWSRLIGLLS
jgi:uncharacterized protein (DUF1919 family)